MGSSNSRIKTEKTCSIPGTPDHCFKFNGVTWTRRKSDTGGYYPSNFVEFDLEDYAQQFGFQKLFFTEDRIEYELGVNHHLIKMCWGSDKPHILRIELEDTKTKSQRIEDIDLTELIHFTHYFFNMKREIIKKTVNKDFGKKLESDRKYKKPDSTKAQRHRVEFIHSIYKFNVNTVTKQLIIEPIQSDKFYIETSVDGDIIPIKLANIMRAEKLLVESDA